MDETIEEIIWKIIDEINPALCPVEFEYEESNLYMNIYVSIEHNGLSFDLNFSILKDFIVTTNIQRRNSL